MSSLLRVRNSRRLPTQIMGLNLTNPVGLAAGLDKNAECVKPFADMGFGFVEVGTVTPRPQTGNPRPRLFRLSMVRAIINRMGFNNVGVDILLENLKRSGKPCVLGINIGKNKDTPDINAIDDYIVAMRAVYSAADYITVNISSPNTPGLRSLQESEKLEPLLARLQQERTILATYHGKHVPIALKIAPDLDEMQIARISRLVIEYGFDAIIATNTTVARPGLEAEPSAQEIGGLSGRPLRMPATEIIQRLAIYLHGKVPIIGVGGIANADDAWEKLIAGADAVQIYTAFIYEGPELISQIVNGLAKKVEDLSCTTLAEALEKARRNIRKY